MRPLLQLALATQVAALGPLWPLPQRVVPGSGSVLLNPATYRFEAITTPAELLKAFKRYRPLFFPRTSTPLPAAVDAGLVVNVRDDQADLALGVNESYNLDVNIDGTAVITAETVWGALRGLETLSQLIVFNFTTGQYSISGLPLHIEDAPRFPHRGLLIDSGRHFEPVAQVKALLDSMQYAKFNVLHWHLTEDQSFPIASRSFPELPQHGAYSDQEQYTWQDISEVVQYARDRGIRVIPEFDMPGHSSSWRNSHPEIFAEGCLSETSRGAFDPANRATFAFLLAALKDWTSGMFVDGFVHLGSDEVPSDCWNNTKDLAWMRSQGLANFTEVFDYFVNQMVLMAKKLGKQTILWDEAFMSAKPPKEAVIQNWHDSKLMQQIVNAGYRALLSNGWYLDHLKTTWESMYAMDPQFNISQDKAHLVLGGEGCMWGETVDPSDMESTIWPRAAAIAERLWSSAGANSTEEAEPRLLAFRPTGPLASWGGLIGLRVP
ncbi:hexb2 [Symbiodinium natans]|uniref:Beta-hexosaminidase n=1 Tax=Symbiodinium natans TaxID=878477 RepID=A0A812TRE0_9DINO|nr:hexb2 [Symbiodinium natans]